MSGIRASTNDVVSTYENLLQDVIRNHTHEDNISAKVKEVQKVVAYGESYLSTLHRVILQVSRDDHTFEEMTYIVKSLPKDGDALKIIRKNNVFETEVIMYRKILPEMNRIVSKVLGISKLAPDSFDAGVDNVIVMEDLKISGYKMADRHLGVDLDHCKIVMKSLARFHGISMQQIQDEKSIMNILPQNLYDKLSSINRVFRPYYAYLSEVVETWSGFERFGPKLRSVMPALAEKLAHLHDRSKMKMMVLNRGDCWVNNILFKYSDTGTVEDCRFVDFQYPRFASPAIDLHYFLVTSPDDEVRAERYEALLEVYHSELCRVLEALGSGDKVTLDWLKQEMEDNIFFALHTACFVLKYVVAEHDDAHNVSERSEECSLDVPQKPLLKITTFSARFKQLFQQMLLTFDKKGLL